MDVARSLLGVVVVIAAAWLLLVAILWLHRPSRDRASVLLRLVPDIGRLVYRLARDPATPMRYRVGLAALGAYLAFPIDLVPDFLPGIGSLDDVIVAAIVLRWIGRGVGADEIAAHWPGSAEGLAMLRRVLGEPA
ncbi:MAG: YkvA family protein [Chloroflexota bacterium]